MIYASVSVTGIGLFQKESLTHSLNTDSAFLLQARMLILQCVVHWCSAKENTSTLESFKRLDKADRFLKVEWDEHRKAFDLSFTGFITELGTSK